MAVKANLSEDQLIQKVFVFSDMEFNEASGHYYGYDSESESESKSGEERQEEREARLRRSRWETDYEVI